MKHLDILVEAQSDKRKLRAYCVTDFTTSCWSARNSK